jgi:hypothetical protein
VRQTLLTCVLVVLCGLATGCGGARDKGKNQDYDRPKSATPR